MTIHIVGAGLAGLLAANMLRHRYPIVHEVQPSLPNNHSAVLRFRTSSVGDVLNIPFRKVNMIKTHLPWKNPVADALAYSFKNSGRYRSDRSITAGLTVADRWIAPADLIPRMAARLDINYGKPFIFDDPATVLKTGTVFPFVISTLPMPVLMSALRYPDAPASEGGWQFNHIPGLNIKANIANCDAYVSLLIPDPALPFSRISITGNEIIIEGKEPTASVIKFQGVGDKQPRFVPGAKLSPEEHAASCLHAASDLLGIDVQCFSNIRSFPQRYAKITPIPDDARKNFMFWATDKFGIFSLGRYATWRPNLLLDDLIQDIRHIDRWIDAGSYAIARHR